MFLDYVKPDLEKAGNGRLYYRLVRTLGIGESQLETSLLDLIDGQTDPTLATYASQFETTLRIASKRATLEEAERAVDEMLVKVREKVGQYIYSDDNEELADVVLDYLLEKGLRLSCAESCTGGSFARRVTDRPGISAVFDRGFVTYSNEAKMEELGVKRETLEKFGAVSPETAREMAEGVYRKTGSDICISVTGIAGPDGGSEKKPVGLFYVGLCFRGEVSSFEFRTMRPRRENVRNYAVREMFATIYRNVIKAEDR
jgi:nicotinamide-nucleotide amidase